MVQRGVNEHTVIELVERFRGSGIIPRLIEYMDVGNRNDWNREAVVPSAELIAAIDARWPLDRVAAEVRGRSRHALPFPRRAGRDRRDLLGQRAVLRRLLACAAVVRRHAVYLPVRGAGHRPAHARCATARDDEALRERLRQVWLRRSDRYSEEREERRQRSRRKIEMHYIGG